MYTYTHGDDDNMSLVVCIVAQYIHPNIHTCSHKYIEISHRDTHMNTHTNTHVCILTHTEILITCLQLSDCLTALYHHTYTQAYIHAHKNAWKFTQKKTYTQMYTYTHGDDDNMSIVVILVHCIVAPISLEAFFNAWICKSLIPMPDLCACVYVCMYVYMHSSIHV
jgi:hypothetical protein